MDKNNLWNMQKVNKEYCLPLLKSWSAKTYGRAVNIHL